MNTQLRGVALAIAATLPAAYAQQAVEKVERIEITGSRLTTSSDAESPSPIAILNARDIKLEGYQSLELILNNYPQFVPDQGNRISLGATGTATANLRGLGPGRTLVLLNGKRMPAGNPFVPSPDLNQIPPQLIQRVEVLTGGASAVYGSDAIAGVVNFIMNDRFEGVQGEVSYDFYSHRQKNGFMQATLRDSGNPIPGDKWMDGGSGTVNLTLGGNFAQDKGNAVVSFRYFKSEALLQSQRDYSACNLNFPADFGIPTPPLMGRCFGLLARWFVWDLLDPTGNLSALPLVRDSATGQVRPYAFRDAFNTFTSYYQRPQERYGVNAIASHAVSPKAKVYAEFGYHDDSSVAQLDPPKAANTALVHYENPFITDDWKSVLTFRNPDFTLGRGPGTTALLAVASRNHDASPIQNELGHTSFREVLGLKGQAGNVDYDLYVQEARVKYHEQWKNDFSRTRFQRALDVVTDPATGAPVCRSALTGADPSCVPYNAWSGTASPAAVAYLQVSPLQQSVMSQRIMGGTVTANLADYGLRLPHTRDPAEIAFGFERRTEKMDFEAGDFEDIASFGSRLPVPKGGGYTLKELFGEVRLPLLDLVDLSGSFRRSEYDSGIAANTLGAGFSTATFKSMRLRGSYQRAIRAANLTELFQPPQPSSFPLPGGDPCAGEAPVRSLADCQRTGVTPSQYGHIQQAGSSNSVIGGNPQLQPETARTYTAGMVLIPSSDLSATLDYYDIRIEDTVSTVPGESIFNGCIDTGDPIFCRLVMRNPANGTLWLEAVGVLLTNQNIGKTRTAGADLAVNYRLRLPRGQKVIFDGLGSYLAAFTTQAYKGAAEQACAGTFHSPCNDMPYPRWRHRVRATWQPPGDFEIAATWRYIGSTSLFGTPVPDRTVTTKLPPMNYLDLAGSWMLGKRLTLRGGVSNVTDRDPPLVIGDKFVNGNTYAQLYDVLGRHFFVSLTAEF